MNLYIIYFQFDGKLNTAGIWADKYEIGGGLPFLYFYKGDQEIGFFDLANVIGVYKREDKING